MSPKSKPSELRVGALSKERIVASAIEILNSDGESALTFRALATRLSTGSGSIYWHVADKDALLAAAAESILARAMAGVASVPDPVAALRALALSVFDTIEAHPWVGTQLAREPWQPAMVEIFERSSAQFAALGVSHDSIFHCVSALVQYLVGTAAQTAAAARHKFTASDRSAVLGTIVEQWTQRDPAQYPFVHLLADQVRNHNERETFLAALDLILAGAKSNL